MKSLAFPTSACNQIESPAKRLSMPFLSLDGSSHPMRIPVRAGGYKYPSPAERALLARSLRRLEVVRGEG